MPFQSAPVRQFLTTGLPGEVSNVGPIFSKNWIVQSTDLSGQNPIGYAYTSLVDGIANPGGDGNVASFVGILGRPKEYVLQGDNTGTLTPTYYLQDNEVGTLFTTAEMWIELTTVATVGDSLSYNIATGAIGNTAVDNITFFAVPGAKVIEQSITAPGIAKIRIIY